jgi:uncharacterized protein (TIGR03435 family)
MTTLPTKMIRTAGFLTLLIPLVIGSLHLSAQSQSTTPSPTQSPMASGPDAQPPLRFEVTSIHPEPSGGDEPSNRRVLPGGRFVATGTTARTLIHMAFATDDNHISSAPSWIDNETFNISAITANHTEVTTTQQYEQLMLSLLEDRFQFKFHREPKESAVYWLEVATPGKLGRGLKVSAPGSKPNMSSNSNGSRAEMKVSNMSMADIAAGLRRQAGRPVEDRTGLKGEFDFQIEWAPEDAPDSVDASLFTVLKEQLGLKLQPAKGTSDMIVIDQIARPSAN